MTAAVPPRGTDRFDLTGRTAVVTGAARGLGRSFAVGLAEAGADLVLVDLPGAEGVAETAAAIEALGRRCRTFGQDLADIEALAGFVDTVRAEAGPLHILVNNAGTAALERFNEITPASWSRIMRVNVDAVFFLSQRIAEHMTADSVPGRIITITSKNALVAEAGLAHYNASKAAAQLLTETLAVELAPHGITANTLAPGMVETPIDGEFPFDREAFEAAYRERIPLGRYAQPDECVGALLLLASDAGAYLTGARLVVDGGVLADQMPRMRFMPPYRNTI
ncbi:SDR family oxidoreductase [Streptomyces poriferorum]|uniref:SDR family oxidoreductase n=1 Tax=Streptomyces poriferorum TaxID=2798799 RepID=A0ABY9IXX7_9ACTN|nr:MULTISPECIES: SDR family oxidoreductase [Streptomyces]MBW5254018.1 SDR family oxidoreductase [Streptomyces poriferorum]MBW5262033.1 SDR family oxidoreductase [Streptomyces poriferorum]MDP5310671.1 SDR family oxidoreductase [Streptomyces sp. Alt4]WLQ47129.1 SDR family oxidoreductase [Streptomyces sp. Alt1]WLQ60180.1 SDR family oxidoreductase [Streptomyces sp. Alt2]